MAGTIDLKGKTKFSLGKMFTGGSMHESIYSGSGALTLAPILLGDIATIVIDGRTSWKVGRDAFLAATLDVQKENKSQGIGKALFSGEDLFVYQITGQGLLWVSSFGAIIQREVSRSQKSLNWRSMLTWKIRFRQVKRILLTMDILLLGIVIIRSREQVAVCLLQ